MDDNPTIDPPSPPHSELYSIDRTTKVLGGVSERWVYQLIYDGEIASMKSGRRTFVVADSVDAYIARNTVDRAS